MPLSINRLGAAILDEVDDVADKTDRAELFKAIARAVIEEIQANAAVSVTVATTGTAAAQTGTGTGTVS